MPCQALHHWINVVLALAPLADHLERVLHHVVQLLQLWVLAFSPSVHLLAESQCLCERFLKDIVRVDLDQEDQL